MCVIIPITIYLIFILEVEIFWIILLKEFIEFIKCDII